MSVQIDPQRTNSAFTPDRLIGGDKKLVTQTVTLTENQAQGALTRGAVLGFDGTNYARVHQTGSFGAATAKAILAEDADPSGGNVQVLVYKEGQFNEDQVTLGGTITLAQVREVLSDVGIHLRDVVSAA